MKNLEQSIYYAKSHLANLMLRIAQDRKEQIESEEDRKKESETEKELRKSASLGETNMTFQDSKKIKIHSRKHPERRKVAGTIRPPQSNDLRRKKKQQNESDEASRQRRLQGARVTKGNTTFGTLSPEDIADIDDITDNIKPIAGTKAKGEFTPARKLKRKVAGMTDDEFAKAKAKDDKRIFDSMDDSTLQQADDIFREISGKPKRVKKTTPLKPPPTFSSDLKKKLASLQLRALETPFTRARAQQEGDKALTDRQDAHTKRITEGVNKPTEKHEPFKVVDTKTIPQSSLIQRQRQIKTSKNNHSIQWAKTRVMYKVASLQKDF